MSGYGYSMAFLLMAVLSLYGGWHTWPRQNFVTTGTISLTGMESLPPGHAWMGLPELDHRTGWVAAPIDSLWRFGDACPEGQRLIYATPIQFGNPHQMRTVTRLDDGTHRHAHRMVLCGPAR